MSFPPFNLNYSQADLTASPSSQRIRGGLPQLILYVSELQQSQLVINPGIF
jgi:hypothetical protein